MINNTELAVKIDYDEGLKAKRNLLLVASLILLALSFSGATIDEANTFIFKIKFANQNGLGILLMLSVVFLMIRYYNYAKPYHNDLFLLWSNRLLGRPYFYTKANDFDEDGGLVAQSRCSELDARLRHDVTSWVYFYHCGLPFTRYIVHEWSYDNNTPDEDRMHVVNIFRFLGIKNYLITLCYEVKEQVSSFFTHRENLDILAPYMLGCLAIVSYYFNTELMGLLELIAP